MLLDNLICEFDRALRTLCAPAVSTRPHPDMGVTEEAMDDRDRKHALGLMRVNHCGEVCAQALYQGQALTARDRDTSDALKQAAHEEVEHLAWTERRIHELGGRTSVLNPLWYGGSLALGITAGILGDRWNLGFLEETEKQVSSHLDSHLNRLPVQDMKSRAIVQQMKIDELQHAHMAHEYGAARLPAPVRVFMRLSAKVMTGSSYYV